MGTGLEACGRREACEQRKREGKKVAGKPKSQLVRNRHRNSAGGSKSRDGRREGWGRMGVRKR